MVEDKVDETGRRVLTVNGTTVCKERKHAEEVVTSCLPCDGETGVALECIRSTTVGQWEVQIKLSGIANLNRDPYDATLSASETDVLKKLCRIPFVETC
eukprot:950655_1